VTVPWAHARGARVALLSIAAIAIASGCTGSEETDTLIAVVLGSVLGLLLAACCGGGWFMGCLVAGGINMRLNTTQPTTRSKGWGYAWGVFNGINGLIAGALVFVAALDETGESVDVEGMIYLSIASLLALVVSVVTLALAAKAEPGCVYEL
jgi:hypothetical protein